MKSSGKFVACEILFVMLASGLPAFAGNAHGGGDDNRPLEESSAWFLGNKTIRYCNEIAPDFGVAAREVEDTVRRVVDLWAKYVEKKRIHSDESTGGKPLSLATRTELLNRCDGKEDVKFYFGVTNAETRAQKTFYFNPTGFAYRRKFDMESGWGNGFVWIAPPRSVFPKENFPDWSVPHSLFGILLHEWGHVLGCEHVDGTIMRESLTVFQKMAKQQPDRAKPLLTQIDQDRELYLDLNEYDYSGLIGAASRSEETRTFRRIAGREPIGEIAARMSYRGGTHQLSFSDRAGTHSFSLASTTNAPFGAFSTPLAIFWSNTGIFKTVRNIPGGLGQIGGKSAPSGTVELASLTAQDGSTYLISIVRNGDSLAGNKTPLRANYTVNGESLQLFTSSQSLE